jgi:hypothetical protein
MILGVLNRGILDARLKSRKREYQLALKYFRVILYSYFYESFFYFSVLHVYVWLNIFLGFMVDLVVDIYIYLLLCLSFML